jgi:hypothetical protein
MKAYNKATAALLVGALLTIAGVLFKAFSPELYTQIWTNEFQGAVHTVISTAFVWFVPNGTEPPTSPEA